MELPWKSGEPSDEWIEFRRVTWAEALVVMVAIKTGSYLGCG
jgi:hypothetical protein